MQERITFRITFDCGKRVDGRHLNLYTSVEGDDSFTEISKKIVHTVAVYVDKSPDMIVIGQKGKFGAYDLVKNRCVKGGISGFIKRTGESEFDVKYSNMTGCMFT